MSYLIRSKFGRIVSAGMTRWTPQVSLHEAFIALLCGRLVPSLSPPVFTGMAMAFVVPVVRVSAGARAVVFVTVVMAVFPLLVILLLVALLLLLWLLVACRLNFVEALRDGRVAILCLAAPSAASWGLERVQIANAGGALYRGQWHKWVGAGVFTNLGIYYRLYSRVQTVYYSSCKQLLEREKEKLKNTISPL